MIQCAKNSDFFLTWHENLTKLDVIIQKGGWMDQLV